MFDFIDNETLKIIVEILSIIVSLILGFFGGATYIKKKNNNKTGNITNSSIISIKQSINQNDKDEK